MHHYHIMQVKLNEIEKALASSPPDQCTLKSKAPNQTSNAPTIAKLKLHRGVPVLPIHPGLCKFGSICSNPDNDDDSMLSPPPPPPPVPQSIFYDYASSPVNSTSAEWSPVPSPSFNMVANQNTSGKLMVTKSHVRRVLRIPNVGKPKLFGGTIDEYVESTQQPIPAIILSCTRVINKYGMRQQGVFRVSGSQAEINEFKDAFERGEDPLVEVCEARDINSTAGLLKLYFRELGEPPFPNSIFPELINCIREHLDLDELIQRLRQVITQNLSRPVFIVMRYLFGFLNQ